MAGLRYVRDLEREKGRELPTLCLGSPCSDGLRRVSALRALPDERPGRPLTHQRPERRLTD